VEDSFYEEVERVFDKFYKYHVKIMLGDFNAKVGREDIFKWTIGNKNFHEIITDNGVRIVNFATLFDHSGQHIVILTTFWSWKNLGRD
jgi:hypothetical protein